MQTMYQTMNDVELAAAIDDLEARVAEVKARELKLDMARGKPSPEQVAISRPMLDLLSADSDLTDGGVDCSNYGCFEGIPSARALAGEFLGVDPSQTLVLGSSSLLIEHDSVAMCWLKARAAMLRGPSSPPRTTVRVSSSSAPRPATTATSASPRIWVSRTFPCA